MLTMFGIPNCDTIRKARKWLDAHEISYQFHDLRKQGLDKEMLDTWVSTLGWEQLLNKRGMMWRKLDDDAKSNINETSAKQIMLEEPAIIKRPLMVSDNSIWNGFNEDDWKQRLL